MGGENKHRAVTEVGMQTGFLLCEGTQGMSTNVEGRCSLLLELFENSIIYLGFSLSV